MLMKKNTESFKEYFERFMRIFNKEEEYIVYGSGDNFERLVENLKGLVNIKYCIDSDEKKCGTRKLGYKIYSKDILKDNNKLKVIVTPEGHSYEAVVKTLEENGYEDEEFCDCNTMIMFWMWFYNKKIAGLQTDFMINTVCSLKCKSCVLHVPYAKKPNNRKFEEVKQDADVLFKTFDLFYQQIRLLGGEPFLNNELGKIVQYIHEYYGDRIKKLEIVTNGTVIPSNDVLKVLSDTKTSVYISDYEPLIKEKCKKKELINLLQKFNITYNVDNSFTILSGQYNWFDLGNPNKEQNKTKQQLKSQFENCELICRHVYNKKWFYCGTECGAYAGGIYEPDENEYIDLEKTAYQKKEEYVLKLMEFNQGNLKLGYVTFCDRCNGFGIRINNKFTPAGEQLL